MISFANISPVLDEILKPTYGQLIYQEQVIEIAMKVAGYDAGRADVIRKTIGRKIKSELDSLIPELIDAFVGYGKLTRTNAETLASAIQACSSYCFNKSHSAEYGLICWQTAYLKANYPLEYMCSLLNGNIHDTEKAVVYINECKKMGIEILPPSVAVCNKEFILEGGKIRIGLAFIKGVNSIECEYEDDESLSSFLSHNNFNKRVRENLIKAGAMDCFKKSRGAMLAYALDISTEIDRMQNKIFKLYDSIDSKSMEYDKANKATKKAALLEKQINKSKADIEKLELDIKSSKSYMADVLDYDIEKGEIETLGFTFRDRYEGIKTEGMDSYNPNSMIIQYVLGEVLKFKSIKDKKGNTMAFVKVLTIDKKEAELVMFSKCYAKLSENKIYLFKIKNKTHLLSAVEVSKC